MWELVLPALERRHDVLALTLPGHAGGPPLHGDVADALERALDEAGFATAHLAGNSAGGFLALELAARGRARSVVAFAPAGGWARDERLRARTARLPERVAGAGKVSAPHAEAVLITPRVAATPPRTSWSAPSTSPPTCCATSCSVSPTVAAGMS